MGTPFDPNNKTCKERGCVRLIGNHCHARDNGKFLLWGGREYPDCEFFEAKKKPTVFDHITESPEILADSVVYPDWAEYMGGDCWTSPFVGHYHTKEEAISATVDKLEDVYTE